MAPALAHKTHQEADDAVLQVVHDKQGHQAEDGQAPVDHIVQFIGIRGQADGGDQRHEHAAHGGALLGQHEGGTDHAQHGGGHGDLAEQLDVGQQAGQHDDDQSADQRARTRLAPAHDDGQQEQDRQLEIIGIGRNVFFRIRVQAAGQPRETGADDEGVDLVAVDGHAHAVRGDGTVAQRLEGASQVRLQDAVHDDERNDHQRGHHIVVLDFRQLVAEQHGLVDLDAHRPFRQEAHFIDQDLHDGAEGQGHHGQVGPRHAQGRQGQDGAEQGCAGDAGGDGQPERHAQLEHQHARGIRADAEQARVAQRHLPRVADDDIEAEQQDGVDQDGLGQVDVIRIRDDDGEQREHGQSRRAQCEHGDFLVHGVLRLS